MATKKKFRGQSATLAVYQSDGTQVPLGILDDPEVSAPNAEVSELRGAGSTEWQDLQKTSTHVEVSGELMSYSIDAWDILIDYDSTNGLDDSAEVVTFEIVVTYEAADGSTKEITVDPCYTENIPIGGSRDEWIGMSLDFTGKTIAGIVNNDADTA